MRSEATVARARLRTQVPVQVQESGVRRWKRIDSVIRRDHCSGCDECSARASACVVKTGTGGISHALFSLCVGARGETGEGRGGI